MATKDFITYDPSSGTTNKTISVTVPQSEGEDRTTSLNITGSDVTKTINISQEGKGIFLRAVVSKFSKNGEVSLNGNVIGNFSGQVFSYYKYIGSSTLSFIASTSFTSSIALEIAFGPSFAQNYGYDPKVKQVKSIVSNDSRFNCYVVQSEYKYSVRLTYGSTPLTDNLTNSYTVTFEDDSTVNIVVTYKNNI